MSERYDLDHVALAADDTAPLLHFLTGTVNATVLWGGQSIGFRPMQVLAGDEHEGMRVELLEPWAVERNDFLARFLAHRGPGPHHLTYKVPDIEVALARVTAMGFEPVQVNIADPGWREAFLHPRQSQGTVIQLAQSSEPQLDRAALLREARAQPARGNPRWWADPLPPSGPPRALERVVIGVPDLAAAVRLHRDVLLGEPDDESSGRRGDASELVWPGGGRVRLEQRPGRAAVDRLEVAGLERSYEVLGTRFVPASSRSSEARTA